MLSIVAAVLLAASPAPAAAAPAPFKLVAPGFRTLNLKDDAARYFSDHLAHALSAEGLRVTTPSEIQAVVGVERERQLLGCSDSSNSCLIELANALGVDGIVTGSLGKFDTAYQVDIKIIAASDAHALASYTGRVTGDAALLDEYSRAAKQLAAELKRQRPGAAVTPPPTVTSAAPAVAAPPPAPAADAASTPAPAGAAPGALAVGTKCSADAQCATGQCLAKACAKAGACNAENGSCRDGNDCCAGTGCDKASGRCLEAKENLRMGMICAFHDQCRSGWCGQETGVCEDPTEYKNGKSCRGVGAYCTRDTNKTCCASLSCHYEYPARCCLPIDSRCTQNDSCCSGKCENGECS